MANPASTHPELLTPREAAAILRCSAQTVCRLIREGKLRASRYGSQQYRIRMDAIVECVTATEVVTQPVTDASVHAALRKHKSEQVSRGFSDKPLTPKINRLWWKGLVK